MKTSLKQLALISLTAVVTACLAGRARAATLSDTSLQNVLGDFVRDTDSDDFYGIVSSVSPLQIGGTNITAVDATLTTVGDYLLQSDAFNGVADNTLLAKLGVAVPGGAPAGSRFTSISYTATHEEQGGTLEADDAIIYQLYDVTNNAVLTSTTVADDVDGTTAVTLSASLTGLVTNVEARIIYGSGYETSSEDAEEALIHASTLTGTYKRISTVEGGVVATLPATSDNQTTFHSVSFNGTYATAPVVVALWTDGGDPSDVRIRNVTTTGFEIAQVEPSNKDGQHAARNDVGWLAVEPTGDGYVVLPGGQKLQANTVETSQTVEKGSATYATEAFANAFDSTPILIAEIQTMNNEDATDPPPGGPATPWMTAAVNDITTSDFGIAMELSEAADDPGDVTGDETIGYIAIEPGTGTIAGVEYVAVQSGATITGDVVTVPFGTTLSSAPIVVAGKTTRVGDDGGWLRHGTITTTGVDLTIEEDTFTDTEQGHSGGEAASIFAFTGAFDTPMEVVPEPATLALAAIGLLALRRRRPRA